MTVIKMILPVLIITLHTATVTGYHEFYSIAITVIWHVKQKLT